MTPVRPAAALSHQRAAAAPSHRLGSAAASILDSSAALIDPPPAPPCSLLQSYSTRGAFCILAVCVFIRSHGFELTFASAKTARNNNSCLYCEAKCKYFKCQMILRGWFSDLSVMNCIFNKKEKNPGNLICFTVYS